MIEYHISKLHQHNKLSTSTIRSSRNTSRFLFSP